MDEIVMSELTKHFPNANHKPRKVGGYNTIWKCLCGEEYTSSAYTGKTIIDAYNEHLLSKIKSTQR